MTKLATALTLAEGGLFLFPLKPGTKVPAISDWENEASQDKELIEKWFYPNNPLNQPNIGIATGPSGLTVLDIDVKNDKDGFSTLVEKDYETPSTFSVETPSGGMHHYYLRGDQDLRNTASKFGDGLDTRAMGGYVVGPSSVIDGKEYAVVNKHKIAEAPAWMLNGSSVVAVVVEEKEGRDLDRDRAIQYLTNEAPLAVQGQGGNDTAYQVACRLRDFGFNPRDSFFLLQHFWNDRCAPPWNPGDNELEKICNHASEYGKNSKGSDVLPFDTFESVEAVALIPLKASTLTLDLPVRDWVLGHRLITGFVSLTVAPGGTGKSMYTMIEAIAVATGRSLLGEKPRKTGPVIIYNTEDPMDEIQRRVIAIALQHNIPISELGNVYLLSGINDPLRVAKTIRGVTQATQDAQRLTDLVKETKAILVVIDPFIRSHSVEENDNNAIDSVVQVFASLADTQKCSISIVHHTRKMPAGTGAGDMDSARGASALASAARIASTLTTMSEKEAKTLEIPQQDRHWYVRVDNAKGNMSPPAKVAEWYRKLSVTLKNGDSVGTLEPVDFKNKYLEAEANNAAKGQVLAPEILSKFGIGCHSVGAVTTWMHSSGFEGESVSTIRRKLMEYFKTEIKIGAHSFKYTLEADRTPKACIEIIRS